MQYAGNPTFVPAARICIVNRRQGAGKASRGRDRSWGADIFASGGRRGDADRPQWRNHFAATAFQIAAASTIRKSLPRT
jgi:hypothetical protein